MKQPAIDFHNPLVNLAGNAYVKKKPSNKKILEQLIEGFSKYGGVAWNPVDIDGGYQLMLRQCPGACGHVWYVNIQDKDTAGWLVNEINLNRHAPKTTNQKEGDK